METFLVTLIVGLASLYLLKRFRRALSGKGCGCGGCSVRKHYSASSPACCSCGKIAPRGTCTK